MRKVPASYIQPACACSIFNVPSCLPTPMPVPHQSKPEDQQLNYLLNKR